MVEYRNEDYFYVQHGYGKGRYRTANRLQGDLPRAVMLYNLLETKAGYKKRLYSPNGLKKTIAKHVQPGQHFFHNPFIKKNKLANV